MSDGTIAIGIATFKRPELLGALLASIAAAAKPAPTVVIVVDNDPDGSAADTVRAFSGLDITYAVETSPGIAEARNRFLALSGDAEFIVFVDDDEFVAENWLVELWNTLGQNDCDVVAGPVIPQFPSDAPAWAVDGGFFERQRHATGTTIALAATNNALVRRAALERLADPWFNTAFSVTGGSDSEFFHRLTTAGSRIVWSDEALVYEVVPSQRMTWAWVRQRATRTGEVRARLLLISSGRARVLGEAVARIAIGGLRYAARAIILRHQTAASMNALFRGLGMLRVLRGRLTQEYSRPVPPPLAS